jgi:hypothetical protein
VRRFLDRDWGEVRDNAIRDRGVYGLILARVREVVVEASRWRLQIGTTLHF